MNLFFLFESKQIILIKELKFWIVKLVEFGIWGALIDVVINIHAKDLRWQLVQSVLDSRILHVDVLVRGKLREHHYLPFFT